MHPFSLPVVLAWCALAVMLLLTALVWWRRPPPQLWPVLLWCYATTAIYCVGANMSYLARTPREYWVWQVVMYTGIMAIPPVWWLGVLAFADWIGHSVAWAGRVVRGAPLAAAGGYWLIMITNPWHGRFLDPVMHLKDVLHPVWYVYMYTAYAIMLGTVATLVWLRWRTRGTQQARQVTMLLFAATLPWAANILRMLGIFSTDEANPTVIALAGSGIFWAIGIYRQGLFALSRITLQRLIDQDPDAVVTLDERGRLHYANAAAHDLLGGDMLQPQAAVLDVLAPRLRSADAPETPYTPATLLAHLNASPATGQGHVFRITDGKCEWVRITAIAARSGRGRLQGYSLRMRDITQQVRRDREERELQARLQEAQRRESLGIMAGGVAHDFNNLLASVLGNAELGLMHEAPDSSSYQLLLAIRNAAERASDLTNQMLAYAGSSQFDFAPVDLTAVVREMQHLLEAVVPREATFEYALETVPRVEADATQLRQVVLSLCANAGEAMDHTAGAIRVRTGTRMFGPHELQDVVTGEDVAPGVYAFLEVSDTGSGIDPENLPRIFDPFFSTKFAGRGLGLATVHGIVSAHKGAIAVDSTLNCGSTFTLYFPASVVAVEAPCDTDGDAAKQEWHSSGTVLVVDDEEVVRLMMEQFLEHLGFTVLTACNGKEGVRVFSECEADIAAVFLDLTMPVMRGDEAYDILRTRNAHVPIILMSGYSGQDLPEAFQRDPRTRFLGKPSRMQAMAGALQELLDV